MLRRVNLGSRQQLEQFVLAFTYPPNSSRFYIPNPGPNSRRCLPTTAATPRLEPFRPHSSGNQLTGANPSTSSIKRIPPIPMQDAHLPIDLLFTLLIKAPDEEQALIGIRASTILSKHLLDRDDARKLVEAMARGPVPHHAIRVLQLAHALGCRLKQSAYECAAHWLAMDQNWDIVLAVVALGKLHRGKTTLRLMNWRVRSLVELGRHDALRVMLEEFRENQVKPDRRSFHLLISGCLRNHDLAGAKRLLRAMEKAGVPVDDYTHAIIATYYRAFGYNPQVQNQILESLPALDQKTATLALNNLIQLCLDAHDIAGSLEILSFYHPIAAKPITKAVSGAISIPDDGDRPLHAQYPQPNPVIPNAETYSIFMNHLTASGAYSQAFDILDSMQSADIPATGETITSLIHLLFASQQGSTAVKLVADMCGSRDFPWRTFSPFTVDQVLALPALTPNIELTTRILNALLKGCLPICDMECAKGVFQIMHANNIVPNASTVEIMVAHLAQKGLPPKQLVRLLLKFCSSNLNIQSTIRHLHPILNSISRHERFLTFGSGWDTVAAQFSRTRRPQTPELLPSRPSDSEHVEPVAGFLPLRPVDRKALQPVLENLAQRNVKSDGVVLGLRMIQEAGNKVDLEGAREVFRTLLAQGHQPTEYHFGALMEGYTRAGDLQGALDVMQSAVDIGVKPNVVMFTIVISGYARQGNPDQAVRTFQKMTAEGIRPDVASIDALSSAFFAVGAYVMARRTLIALWHNIEPFPEDLRRVSLKQLAKAFRAIQPQSRRKAHHSLSKFERVLIDRQIVRLLEAWQEFIVEQGGCTDTIANKKHYNE
ncbi:hypothetical protein V5O48_002891 [Marasmius crinis-equi]|uniref:Pentatricopeptide repeat-containing protein n=1 Tax=Marasmius crinis-equi TaxID=585013 RepID=A0ABR3FUU5_9AGAR